MQPLQLSDEILLLALLPLCPLPCVLQLAAVARRAGPGQLTTRRPPRTGPHGAHARFAGRPPLPTLPRRARAVLLHFGGHHSGDFAHPVAARRGLHPRRNVVRTLPGNSAAPNPPTSRAAPVHRPAARSSEVIRRSSSSSGWPRTRTASPARPWRRFCGGTRGATCGSAVTTGRRHSCSSSRWRTVRELLSFPSARRPVIGPTSLRCEWWRPSA